MILAAKIVAEAAGLRNARPGIRAVIDFLHPLTTRPTSNVLKDTSAAARCICDDPD